MFIFTLKVEPKTSQLSYLARSLTLRKRQRLLFYIFNFSLKSVASLVFRKKDIIRGCPEHSSPFESERKKEEKKRKQKQLSSATRFNSGKVSRSPP